jgi:hypothetical protein
LETSAKAEKERAIQRQELLEDNEKAEKERDARMSSTSWYRNLQVTILAVGSGIGAGQTASSVPATWSEPIPKICL